MDILNKNTNLINKIGFTETDQDQLNAIFINLELNNKNILEEIELSKENLKDFVKLTIELNDNINNYCIEQIKNNTTNSMTEKVNIIRYKKDLDVLKILDMKHYSKTTINNINNQQDNINKSPEQPQTEREKKENLETIEFIFNCCFYDNEILKELIKYI